MGTSYSVGELAELAGVSVRTLRHYDDIGLLAPGSRSAAGYRVYGEAELLRLQQILLYRELEIPLERIGAILDSPDHDLAEALGAHRSAVEERLRRLELLLRTIDKTIARLGGRTTNMTDAELYEGLDRKQAEAWENEAEERWGASPAWKQSKERVARMSKEEWAAVKAEGGALEADCAAAAARGVAPDSAEARALMARRAAWLRHFYEPGPELFAGLGEMYLQDPRFRAHYEKTAPGLAEWLRDAMAAFAARGMRP